MQTKEAHIEIYTKELGGETLETCVSRSGDEKVLTAALAGSIGGILMSRWREKDVARHQAVLFMEKVMNAIESDDMRIETPEEELKEGMIRCNKCGGLYWKEDVYKLNDNLYCDVCIEAIRKGMYE